MTATRARPPAFYAAQPDFVPVLASALSPHVENDPAPAPAPASAFDRQEAGNHYAKMAVQPAHFILGNGIPWAEGSVIQYVARWRDKGGLQDLRKAIHLLEMLIEHEEGRST